MVLGGRRGPINAGLLKSAATPAWSVRSRTWLRRAWRTPRGNP